MENVTVGFGRSIGSTPAAIARRLRSDRRITGGELTDWEWGELRHEVEAIAEECGGDVHFTGTGIGRWDGVEETAGCVAFFADATFNWPVFRLGLHTLCVRFYQDAIAVTAAESELYT